jgi:hypothetical protein
MKNFLSLLKNRKIDYIDIKEKNSLILLNNEENYFINVIIGCRGRKEFLPHVVSSFNNAIDFYKNNKICLTIVEHNPFPEHLKFCKKNKINYVWSCGNIEEQYSRSFAYNFGVKYSNDAKYYLLHDLDILVKKNFFLEIEKNLNNFKCLQTYGNRRVLYMSKELTEKVLNNEADYNFFNEKNPGVSLPMFNGAPALGSKGGSILIEKDLFYKVGGFDPEIFWGYAAEDQFFWEKVLQLTEIGYSDNPVIDMFHMWHPPSFTTNPSLIEMENYWLFFKNLSKEEKINIINLKKEMYE